MDHDEVDSWIRETAAAIDANPDLIAKLPGLACPACGGRWIAVKLTTGEDSGECECRECGHKWRETGGRESNNGSS
jgi:hypothetical protein